MSGRRWALLVLLICGDVYMGFVRLVRLCSIDRSRLLVWIVVIVLLFLFILGFLFSFTLEGLRTHMCWNLVLLETILSMVYMLGAEIKINNNKTKPTSEKEKRAGGHTSQERSRYINVKNN